MTATAHGTEPGLPEVLAARAAPAPGWFARLGERWRDWRNQTVARPGFQAWAAAFPLTRPLARRHAREVFDLVAGFVYSQVLLACVRLDLFERLARGAQSEAALAQQLGLGAEALERLLAAAASLELVERRRGPDGPRVALGRLGAPLVGNRAVTAMVEHHATLYQDLADPLALLQRRVRPAMAGYWPYVAYAAAPEGAGAAAADSAQGSAASAAAVEVATTGAAAAAGPGPSHAPPPSTATPDAAALPPERVADYSVLMSASQPLVTAEVLAAHDFRAHRVLLDVGGGEGSFLCAVAAQAPQLELMLFDLPAVAARAAERLRAAGLGARASTHGGDFFRDELPAGADAISLVRVAFDHPDERVLRLLRAARRALAPGGTLLLAEPMAGVPGAQAMGDAYFGMYLLAMGRGRPRTAAELTALLHAAGFSRVRQVPTRMPLQAGLLLAR